MNRTKLDKANALDVEIAKLRELASDLKHINRRNKDPYNPGKNKAVATWKKLFSFTSIEVSKDIRVDPKGIRSTTIYPEDFDLVKIQIGNMRSEVIDLMIKRLMTLANNLELELKNL